MVNMKIIQTFLLLCMILPSTRAADIVCGGKTSQTVLIGKGDSFTFKTQSGPTYQPNTKCQVKYKLRNSCRVMTFFCPVFDIENNNKNCKRPDRMTIATMIDGMSKHFCQKNGPNVKTRGTLQVKFVTEESTNTPAVTTTTTTTNTSTGQYFLTDESRQAAGAECVAQCYTKEDTYYDTYGTDGTTGSYGTYTTYLMTTYPYTTFPFNPTDLSGVSELLRLLTLLRIPVHETVDVPGSWESATISSDNILHDVTISYKGGRYNVRMEDVASIINIPQMLRNVKVFHHQGAKHLRIVRHGDQGGRKGGTKFPAKKGARPSKLIHGKGMLHMKKKGKGNPTLINGKNIYVMKKGTIFHKPKQ